MAILTRSENPADIAATYRFHANIYLDKPSQFDGFESLMESINDFWLTRVKSLHPQGEGRAARAATMVSETVK